MLMATINRFPDELAKKHSDFLLELGTVAYKADPELAAELCLNDSLFVSPKHAEAKAEVKAGVIKQRYMDLAQAYHDELETDEKGRRRG